jgi:peptidoglycan/xylan/chitin deacetylase (PgdA/CDA1 family)
VTTVAVLGYHKIGRPSLGGWETWYYVPEETLAAHITQVRDRGWEFVDLATFIAGVDTPGVLPDKAALLTFDDGYRSVLTAAAPVLADAACPGVVFVPTAFIGDVNRFDANTHEPVEPLLTWDELRVVEDAGIAVQSHGTWHRAFSAATSQEMRGEVVESKAALDAFLGRPTIAYAYSYGDCGSDHDQVDGVLRESGYRAAFMYGGGPVELPTPKQFRLPRLAMGPDSDVDCELAGIDNYRDA